MSAKQTAKDDEESARQIQIGGSESLDEAVKIPESEKWTFAQACALNTLNMFGTGPFVTIPLVMAAGGLPGPQVVFVLDDPSPAPDRHRRKPGRT